MIRANHAVASALAILALGSAALLNASTGHTSNSGALQRLYLTGDGTIKVTLKDRPASAEDCGTNQYYVIPNNHPDRDTFLAALLMAWSSGHKVNFRVTDGHASGTNCDVSYMVLDR